MILNTLPSMLVELLSKWYKTIHHVNGVLCDSSHVLKGEYELMNSGKRYKPPVPLCNHNHYKHSFVPLSINLINKQLQECQQSNRGRS